MSAGSCRAQGVGQGCSLTCWPEELAGGGRKTPGQSVGTEPEGRTDRAGAFLTRSPWSTRGGPHTLGPVTVLME